MMPSGATRLRSGSDVGDTESKSLLCSTGVTLYSFCVLPAMTTSSTGLSESRSRKK